MFTSNPFAELTAFLPPVAMQAYIVLMVVAVVVGTILDMLHKSSAKFFILNTKKSKARAARTLSGSETAALAVKTIAKEVVTSGEFCSQQRRISHLFMFYGFLAYVTTTVAMIFAYPTPEVTTPGFIPVLWHIGVLMIMLGGYWFFFLLRVNVAQDGQPVFRLVEADLFIVTLLGSVTFALIWRIVDEGGYVTVSKIAFGLYILFTTVLFGTVRWAKFAHMFFKPVVAYQRRVEEAEGSSTLPSSTPHHEAR